MQRISLGGRLGRMVPLALIAGLALTIIGCATKDFVREQVGATDSRLADTNRRVEGQEGRLRDASGQLEAGRQRLDTFDTRLGEVGGLAGRATEQARDARKAADDAAVSTREMDGRLSSRIANRNKYSALDTRMILFEFGKADVGDQAINELREVSKALREDLNAVVELRGHTDAVGNDQANVRLSRDRVDAIVRYLVHKEGIELRRIHAVGLGKVAPLADNNTREGRARNRRVDVTLRSPQS
ncbi:MAG TPA: OmpA family protein [Candidatus Limnocylindrales bacterium]|nr:OmpA family protein [Candidatus Limnocylindrales bacterium]